jgi:hypothetical protein
VLGKGAEYYMIDFDPRQVFIHRAAFISRYPKANIFSDPHLEWESGAIESFINLIKYCDVLLFHNYVPVPRDSFLGREPIFMDEVVAILGKIVDARPKTMAFYLPDFKSPEEIAIVLESLNMHCELVDGVHYAGDLEGQDPKKWIGKALIATIRT